MIHFSDLFLILKFEIAVGHGYRNSQKTKILGAGRKMKESEIRDGLIAMEVGL
jgi:hypothetical protein